MGEPRTGQFHRETFERIPPEKQETVLRAAIAEFAERGLTSANINDIAKSAGVSVGAMYKYFSSKEDLFLAAVHRGVEELSGVLDRIVSESEGLFDTIEKIISAIQLHSRKDLHLTRLYNQMTAEGHSGIVWKVASDMEGVSAGLYASMLADAQRRGEVRADLNPRLSAFFLDNLFVILQFSYACEYYAQRMKIFVGEELADDGKVRAQLVKFIRGALSA